MNTELTAMLTWAAVSVIAFGIGWATCANFEGFKARGAAVVAEERAKEEHTHGFEQGYVVGMDIGVRAGAQRAQRIAMNKQTLAELAARRFAVGGLAPHE
jgi:hypothetical protein